MKILQVLLEPDPLLHRVSAPVMRIDTSVRELLDRMVHTMYAHNGIGLAAPQVGVLQRMLVIDLPGCGASEGEGALKLINPEIVWASNHSANMKEGCLSVPIHYIEIVRPSEVKIRYQDPEGRMQELHADGLLAACLQHELDHLNGVTILNYLSSLKKSMALRKIVRAKRAASLESEFLKFKDSAHVDVT